MNSEEYAKYSNLLRDNAVLKVRVASLRGSVWLALLCGFGVGVLISVLTMIFFGEP